MHERPHPHLDQTRAIWEGLERYRRAGKLTVDGQSLDVAGVVAVSRCVPTQYLHHITSWHKLTRDIGMGVSQV